MTHEHLALANTQRQRIREALYAFTTLGFYDLAADLAAFIGFGVDVDVQHAFFEVGSLRVGKRRRAFERAGERLVLFRNWNQDAGVLAGFGGAVEMCGGGGPGKAREVALPGQHLGCRIVARRARPGAVAYGRRHFA